jgi:hypothetical protein
MYCFTSKRLIRKNHLLSTRRFQAFPASVHNPTPRQATAAAGETDMKLVQPHVPLVIVIVIIITGKKKLEP